MTSESREETDDCRALERELTAYRPVRPSPLVKRRIREAVDELPGRGLPRARVPIFPAAAAAVILVLAAGTLLWRPFRGGAPVPGTELAASDPELLPEEETVWVGGEVQGIVETAGGPPMWKVRYETVHRTSWSDAEGTTLQRFVPEERYLFMPVSHH